MDGTLCTEQTNHFTLHQMDAQVVEAYSGAIPNTPVCPNTEINSLCLTIYHHRDSSNQLEITYLKCLSC